MVQTDLTKRILPIPCRRCSNANHPRLGRANTFRLPIRAKEKLIEIEAVGLLVYLDQEGQHTAHESQFLT